MYIFRNYETITEFIRSNISKALKKYLKKTNEFSLDTTNLKINVDVLKNHSFGDFASNVVLSLPVDNTKKKQIATNLINFFNKKYFKSIQVGGHGYLNFYVADKIKKGFLNKIIKKNNNYGHFCSKKLWYNIEFVSANPTGYLHIGHARNAAYGETLASIWKAYGIKVDKEYYVNDGGNQINKLALSVLIRYLEKYNKHVSLPEDSYHGEEIILVAEQLKKQYNDKFINVKFDQQAILDHDANMEIGEFAKTFLLNIIKNHLAKLGVTFDIWALESDIYKNDLVNKTLSLLKDYVYQKDGATWLKTTKFGDDKDRVIIKSDKSYTYFAPDIAYHNLKLSRGYDVIYNIWGADHKSYVDRMTIAVQMLGFKKEQIYVCIMQLVRLFKNGQEFKMSKRSGNSFTCNDLIELIGSNAARWYLVNQSLDTHIQIDIDKAKSRSSDNPLFYVNYAYVRIKNILNKTTNITIDKNVNLLTHKLESELISQLMFFKPTIENIARSYEVHKMCLYLINLAKIFHSYYEQQIINDNKNIPLTAQRLFLINAIAIVIKNALNLLGIKVSEQM